MREELLKSVAAPSRLFLAPFGLVIMNLVLTMVFIVGLLAYHMGGYIWVPIVTFLLTHLALVAIGTVEPHIDNMLALKLQFRAKTRNMIKEPGDKFAA
ncbi:MAG: hypothetical protein LBL52_03185 [Rickettsiales bacterium]|nr:hypothetical protein [Rickettsiales bacterium]